MIADSNENDTMKRAKEAIEKYFFQLTQGCGRFNCTNTNCASNANFVKLTSDQAAALAIRLAKEKAEMCDTSSSSKPAKQFKPSLTNANITPSSSSAASASAIVATASASSVMPSTSLIADICDSSCLASSNKEASSNTENASSMSRDEKMLTNYDEDDEDDEDDDDDGDDDDELGRNLTFSNSLHTMSSVSAMSSLSSSANLKHPSSRQTSQVISSSNLKSLDDALKDACKFVSSISENAENLANAKITYLTEQKVQSLIQKAKRVSSYKHLLKRVQHVFSSYNSLSYSFRLKKSDKDRNELEILMPVAEPFTIDIESTRRSIALLFSLNDEKAVEEMEKVLDNSVYTLCASIRMSFKKIVNADSNASNGLSEQEMNKILNSLLIINELPLLDDPKYMDRCAKCYYATIYELPIEHSVKLVRTLALWHSKELCSLVNKLQQYITVCVISKNLDEEDSNRNQNSDDTNDNDDSENNERICLHKSEGISGAVSFLRLIYYASLLGGRLDSPEQIEREREIEKEDIKYYEENVARESQNASPFSEIPLTQSKPDRIEELLMIRPLDCREPKVPLSLFINECANKFIDIQHDYVEYIQQIQYLEQQQQQQQRSSESSSSHFRSMNIKKPIFAYLLNPFFLDITKKNLGLYYDNKIKMIRERRNDMYMSIFEGYSMITEPYLKIRLQRNNILSEALTLIELQDQENSSQLRKQLVVEFENEQGIDQGGVSKEFFHLAIDELFNKGYTFFIYDEQTKYYWFNPCSLESDNEFKLIGILFGIAIYNNVILDVQFPKVFFRKLMGKLGTLEDLAESHPNLYQSLKAILDFEGTESEFEETFMLNFQISLTDTLGSAVSFNLKENGDQIAVTKETRQEFVNLYSDFMLNKGIESSFRAFRRGFMKMTINSPLNRWYLPNELEILICGSQVLDWKSLQASTIYDSGFDKNHYYIKFFWEVFEEFSEEQKMLFLKFTTGTDRCPHGGLAELKLTIARNGPGTEKLPTAHTCFNVLLLPEYSSKQTLKEKLLKAIEYSRGFGLS